MDFADIRNAFDKTNQAYLNQPQDQLGNEFEHYTSLFKSEQEIETEIAEIKEKLWDYDLLNAENFTRQINQLEDRKQVLDIKKALQHARDLYNLIRLSGHFDLLQKIDFRKLGELFGVAHDHLCDTELKARLAR